MTDSFVNRLRGIIPPVISPLTPGRRFDDESARNVYEYMLECGVHGLFLFGSSGEGASLRQSDRETAIGLAVDVCRSRVPVLAGVLEPATDLVIQQAQIARELGADAIVVCPPFYFPTTQPELLRHFRTIREAVDLPILAYDIPVTTKVKIHLNTMLTLAREGTIVGVKDSSGDQAGFRRLMRKRPDGFRMLTGAELLVDTVLLPGADGSVPGLSNVAPKPFVELYDHWNAGQVDVAVEIQNRLVRLFEVFVDPLTGDPRVGYAIGSMKIANQLRGLISDPTLCEPLEPVSEEQEELVRTTMIETGVL